MKKKVAAYCRVSTKEDIQRHSLEHKRNIMSKFQFLI